MSDSTKVRCCRCDEMVTSEQREMVIAPVLHRCPHGVSCVGGGKPEHCEKCFHFKQRQLDLFPTEEPTRDCIKCGKQITQETINAFDKLKGRVKGSWAEPFTGPKVCAPCLWKTLDLEDPRRI